jgi:hypothetical protein
MYINHSGGAEGSDMAWETVGLQYGVKTIAYSFHGHTQYGANPYIMNTDELNEGWEACLIANETLNRSIERQRTAYVRKLICRNWFQVKYSEAIFAVGTLVKGSRKIVNGGTGWAVQMGIDNKKSVYLFDQDERRWKCYSHSTDRFVNIFVPFLTDDFAGIGTRNITDDGLQAILDVYEQTLGDVK